MKWLGPIALSVALLVWWWWPSEERKRTVRDEAEQVAVEEVAEGEPALPEPEAPLPELAPRATPSDPVERGPCTLEFHLQDAETGEPVAGVVALYRLDAPGNEHWTRGDRLQASVEVPVGGTNVEDLPAGFYRPHCLSQRFPPIDHESFEVTGARTTWVVRVPMPRSFRAFLVVRDENGRGIERGDLSGISLSSSMRPAEPHWLRPRAPRDSGILGLGGGAGGSRVRSGSRRFGAVGPRGRYQLATYAEDDCRLHRRVLWFWRSAGRSEVRALLDLEGWRETTFVGVSVPLAPIHAAVLLPSGQRAVDAGAEFSAWCYARAEEAPARIEVQVRLAEFQDLRFAFAPGDELPVRTMVAKP